MTTCYYLLKKKNVLIHSKKIFGIKGHNEKSWYSKSPIFSTRNKVSLIFSSFCTITLPLSLNVLNTNFHTLVHHGIIVFHLEMLTALLHRMVKEDFSEGMRLWWTKRAYREGSLRRSGGTVGRSQGGRAGPPRRKALFWLLAAQCFPLSPWHSMGILVRKDLVGILATAMGIESSRVQR